MIASGTILDNFLPSSTVLIENDLVLCLLKDSIASKCNGAIPATVLIRPFEICKEWIFVHYLSRILDIVKENIRNW